MHALGFGAPASDEDVIRQHGTFDFEDRDGIGESGTLNSGCTSCTLSKSTKLRHLHAHLQGLQHTRLDS